jgi:hypothetical protein
MRVFAMAALAQIDLMSCWSGPSTHHQQQVVVPGKPVSAPDAEIEITEHRIGALTHDTIATVEQLSQQLPGFDIRKRKVEFSTVLDVYDHGELLYYVVPNHDHSISMVHISSRRVVDRVTGWRVGDIVKETGDKGCRCGELASDFAFAIAYPHWVSPSFGSCQHVEPTYVPTFDPTSDESGENPVSCPTSGTIERMVWYAPGSRR